MPPRPPSVSRRTTLGAPLLGLLGLVAVAGCDLDDLDPRSDPATPADPVTSAPPEDADTTLVAGVVADLGEALVAATAVRGRVRAAARPLARLHRRHLDELGAADRAFDSPGVAASGLLRLEQRLQRRLASAAVAAESGELARVLASMSAAVAQQLAAQPPTAGSR